MVKNSTRVASIAGAALMAVLATVTVGSPADAAIGSSPDVFFARDAGGGKSVLPSTFIAGDCRLEGANQTDPLLAEVALTDLHTTTFGQENYQLYWGGITYTVKTHTGDVWHGTFIFKTAGGTEVFRHQFDSPVMRTINRPYSFQDITNVTVGLPQFASIATVDWVGDC